ncbi:MAG TPA: CocE/NonD family hydrolase [Syntrophorhabdaceae bacterium]|nr:CocE/NonD family hydrolase [Syntrophorhabdaceae bacterium]
MSIERVSIESDYTLEGLLHKKASNAGVIICHPHSLYGGDMRNSVVTAMEDGFSSQGYTTLIFNFRGVGHSQGEYDEGEGEVRDALAANAFLRARLDNNARMILAGYSFGAWVMSRAALNIQDFEALFLISFPFVVYKSDYLKSFNKKMYLVGGTDDDIAPLEDLLTLYRGLNITDKYLKVITTTHFYPDKEGEIVDFIKETVASPSSH